MKKYFAILFAFVMIFACIACAENEETKEVLHDSQADVPYVLEGEVLSISTNSITVKTDLYDGLGIVVSTNFLEGFGYKSDISNIAVGDCVRVLYDGKVAESYPPQILSVYSINKIGCRKGDS